MTEEAKAAIDGVAGATTLGAFFSWIPEATAVAALAWWLIRIFETETVKSWLKR